MAFGIATIFTNAGKALVTNFLSGGVATVPKYIGAGVGATGAARTALATDTALSSALPEGRATGVGTRTTATVTNDTLQVVGTIAISGTRALDEVGLFDAATSGNMFLSATHAIINLTSGDEMTYMISVTFA